MESQYSFADMRTCRRLGFAAILLAAAECAAAVPSIAWLPEQTKFHLVVPDYAVFNGLFAETGIGRFLDDPAVQPFLRELPNQLRSGSCDSRLSLLWVDLGVDWERFRSVPRGEVAWAVVDVGASSARLLVADVTGRGKEVGAFREEVAAAMATKKARMSQQRASNATITVYDVPAAGKTARQSLVHFVQNDVFVATDNLELARQCVDWLQTPPPKRLADQEGYRHVMQKCAEETAAAPHVSVFAVPIDLSESLQKITGRDKPRDEHAVNVARNQGFSAVSAAGAFIYLREGGRDFHFVGSLYAPKPWSKSMRMVELKNRTLLPAAWVTAKASSYIVMNIEMESFFENVGPLFDEVVGEGQAGTWRDVKESLREDLDGPRLDMETEIFKYLTGPVVVIEQAEMPVRPESLQVVLAVATSDETALRTGINKAMKDDPTIEARAIGDVTAYASSGKEGGTTPLWIVAVAKGNLLLASDFAILAQVLQDNRAATLADDARFEQVAMAWREELDPTTSVNVFRRLDEWLHVRYELRREGRSLSPNKSVRGMLNSFLGSDPIAEHVSRCDASKLPPFSSVRKYFGILDAAVQTTATGWLVVGHISPPAAP